MLRLPDISKRTLYQWGLVGGDALGIIAGFLSAYGLRNTLDEALPYSASLASLLPPVLLMTILAILLFAFSGLYSPNNARVHSMAETLYSLAAGVSISVTIALMANFTIRSSVQSRLLFALAWVLAIAFVALFRVLARLWLSVERAKGNAIDKVIIVGARQIGLALKRNIDRRPWLGYSVAGFVDDQPDDEFLTTPNRPLLIGGLEDLNRLIGELDISEVIIALPSGHHGQVPRIMRQCQAQGVRFRLVPDLFEITLSRLEPVVIGGIPLIGIRSEVFHGWNQKVKRAIDIAIASATLIALAPLLAIIAIAIRLDSPGPILFRQRRVGLGGNTFEIFKFRSMYQNAEALIHELRAQAGAKDPTFKMVDDPRITRVGRVIRRFSLDELPQLLNIIKGDMSLVGPRPPIPYEVEMYEEWQKRRLEVIPGLTGLWQVSGRSELSFSEMVKLDLYYIENWSLSLDLKIMLRTIPVVLASRGAY